VTGRLLGARLLDGRALAATLRAEIAAEVAGLAFQPGLVVVLVGDNAASQVYVRTKDRAAAAAGIAARTLSLPAATTETDLLATIAGLNADATVDGILVQLPLPAHISPRKIIEAIDPAKDVDGFHPLNVGRLHDGQDTLVPCTPQGCMRLLRWAGIDLAGRRALVLGRSAIVGKPMAALLTQADATVTLAHSRSRDLAEECFRADIVVAGVGRPKMVRAEWIAPGATVIDVGINRLDDGTLVGDVDPAAAEVAGAITPVPGGVGPMTIACLLANTVKAARARRA